MFMVILAVLPAVALMVYIYKKDTVEKEPKKLLLALFLLGALLTIAAAIAETVLQNVFYLFIDGYSVLSVLIENFIIVALVEEGGKYLIFRKKAYNAPSFDHTFDAIVYSVFISLGFAAAENILYVAGEGIGIALMRGVMSVPGHAIDAVFMGYFFAMAKKQSFLDNGKEKQMLLLALIVPTLLHGFYDFCLSMNSIIWIGIFAAYEVCITIAAFALVNRLSNSDTRLAPTQIPDEPLPLWDEKNEAERLSQYYK